MAAGNLNWVAILSPSGLLKFCDKVDSGSGLAKRPTKSRRFFMRLIPCQRIFYEVNTMSNVNSRKNLLLIAAVSTLAVADYSLCATAQAAPLISSVSGSISNGNMVTVSGSGLEVLVLLSSYSIILRKELSAT